jgi:RNA polymerase-interacting CarD/CdnL/TRCF family regulator
MRAVWLRHGVVESERLHTSAGEAFVIVTPFGWEGEPGWIPMTGIDLHLRPLASADDAARWLDALGAPPVRRTRGDLVLRRKRHRRTVEYGSVEQQVAALAEAYGEAHRPDVDDRELLERLERLVVVEIATVLGRDPARLRDELRAGRPRFRDDAPRSGQLAEPEPDRPAMPAGFDWFTSFFVHEAVRISDLADTDLTLEAVDGPWHAAWFAPPPGDDHADDGEEREGWIAVAESHRSALPLDPAAGRLVALTDGTTYPLAVVDAPALDEPVIVEEVWSCESCEVHDRGGVSFWRSPTRIRAWEERGRCVAVEVTTRSESEADADTPLLDWPLAGEHVIWRQRGVARVEAIRWNDDDDPVVDVRAIDADEDATLRAHGLGAHLRPLVDRDTAQRAIAALAAPTTPRPPGDAAARDRRYRDALVHGTPDEQVTALAHVYAEPHRPDDAELETLARFERLVLGELACVLGMDRPALAAQVRAGRPRFAPDAPAAADAPAPADVGPALPAGFRWISTFQVAQALQITDLTSSTVSLPARPGPWHAAWRDADDAPALVVVSAAAVATLPRSRDDIDRVIRVDGGRDFALAVLDAGALQSSLVSNALIEGAHADVMGRGVAWLPTEDAVEVRVWLDDGECVAAELAAVPHGDPAQT